jgi:hypothetical protein
MSQFSLFTVKLPTVLLIYYVCCPQCNVYELVKLASQHFVVDVHDVTNQLKYIMLLKVLILNIKTLKYYMFRPYAAILR